MTVPGIVQAAEAPYLIGSATQRPGNSTLPIQVTRACPKGDMIQVVAVAVGANGVVMSASDSGGVNIYQPGGGKWRSGSIHGSFLATTSPSQPTSAGLSPPATITVTYAKPSIGAQAWKAAIAECVPGLQAVSGSADNQAGSSPTSGSGPKITLKPSSRLLTLDEPLFIATVLLGDASDTWRESAGYRTLLTLKNGNTLNLAYQIIPGARPTPYAATNSAARQWSASNRSYKTRMHN